MNQKINDLKILFQNDKRFTYAGLFILVVIVVMLILPSKGGSGPRTVTVADTDQPKNGMGTPNSYQELVEAFKTHIDVSKREQSVMRAVPDRNGQDLKNQKEQVAGIFKSIVDNIENLDRKAAKK